MEPKLWMRNASQQQFGPFSKSQILSLARAKLLPPAMELSSDLTNWRVSGTMKGLFPPPTTAAGESDRAHVLIGSNNPGISPKAPVETFRVVSQEEPETKHPQSDSGRPTRDWSRLKFAVVVIAIVLATQYLWGMINNDEPSKVPADLVTDANVATYEKEPSSELTAASETVTAVEKTSGKQDTESAEVVDSPGDSADAQTKIVTAQSVPPENSEQREVVEPLVSGPSFDCAKASTQIEDVICADGELSQADGELGREYVKTLAEEPVIRKDQIAWIKSRNATCGPDVQCLLDANKSRISELRGRHQTIDTDAPEVATQVKSDVIDSNSGPTQLKVSNLAPTSPAEGESKVAGDEAKIPLRGPIPRYPPALFSRGIEGTVLLRFQLDRDGHVTNVVVAESSGHREFDRSAMQAARNWYYIGDDPKLAGSSELILYPVRFGLSD